MKVVPRHRGGGRALAAALASSQFSGTHLGASGILNTATHGPIKFATASGRKWPKLRTRSQRRYMFQPSACMAIAYMGMPQHVKFHRHGGFGSAQNQFLFFGGCPTAKKPRRNHSTCHCFAFVFSACGSYCLLRVQKSTTILALLQRWELVQTVHFC